MSASSLISVVLLVLSIWLAHAATAFGCGKPGALCGNSIPVGVQCDKGAGWCEPGHFCGFSKGIKGSTCLPVDKDCGRAGNKCCPSNADKPHRANSTGINPVTGKEEARMPFCRDGSTCFFDSQLFVSAQAPAGLVDDFIGCVAVPKDCGQKEGSPCCPNTYHIATNPPLGRGPCRKDLYCSQDKLGGPKFPGSHLLLMPTGICMANMPDCGKLGKPCCVYDMLSTTHVECNPGKGVQGYCADKSGRTRDQAEVRMQDLICNACPHKIDDALKASRPAVYKECKPLA